MKTLVLSVLALPVAVTPLAAMAQAVVQPVATATYTDGTFTGPSANAYYGNIQLAVIIKGGQITGFQLLDYPSHTGTSQRINQEALPMLAREVLTAQSGQVDFISGATLSSQAFMESVGGALLQARR